MMGCSQPVFLATIGAWNKASSPGENETTRLQRKQAKLLKTANSLPSYFGGSAILLALAITAIAHATSHHFFTPDYRWSGPIPLPLDQNRLVVFEILLHGLYVGKRYGGALCLMFDELIVHQVLAHQVNVKMRILHLPDLTGFQRLLRNSAFLIHYHSWAMMSG
jgi:hypothetical protein